MCKFVFWMVTPMLSLKTINKKYPELIKYYDVIKNCHQSIYVHYKNSKSISECLYMHAKKVKKFRWFEAESLIRKSKKWADAYYALYVNEEMIINEHPRLIEFYDVIKNCKIDMVQHCHFANLLTKFYIYARDIIK